MRLTTSASAHIKAPRRVVYSALTAYRQYDIWVPDIVRSRLFAREGELAVAEFIAPPYGRGKIVLEFVESAPEAVVFKQVDQFREEGLFGSFDLLAAKHETGTIVKAQLGAKVGIHRSLGCRRRLRRVLKRTMEALSSRALKLLTSGLSDVPDQRAKVMELEIGSEEVTLQVGSTTYELVRSDRGGSD